MVRPDQQPEVILHPGRGVTAVGAGQPHSRRGEHVGQPARVGTVDQEVEIGFAGDGAIEPRAAAPEAGPHFCQRERPEYAGDALFGL